MTRKLKLSLLVFTAAFLFHLQLVSVKADVAAGPITLNVDATEAPRKLFHAHMTSR